MSANLAVAVQASLKSGAPRIVGDDGDGLDAQTLAGAVTALADIIAQAGVIADEPVILIVGNQSTDVIGFLAIWLAGCVATPVHASSPLAVIDALAVRTGARWCVRAGRIERISHAPPPERAMLVGAALIIFTSGSTGVPKGVVIGHRGMMHKLDVLARLLPIGPADTVAMPLQLTFIFGIWVSLLTLLAGGTLALVAKASHAAMAETLGRSTVLAAVPTMLRALMSSPHPSAPHLLAILTGGETLAPSLAGSLTRAYPKAGIFDLFGLTETGSCDFCLRPQDQPEGLGSIGRPTDDVTYRLARQPGDEGAAITGELQIRTPSAMLGYLDAPELTANAFEDGYFKTGDIAREHTDGRIELIGRSKEIIARGGTKISPIEIDHLFLRHDDVAAAMAAGLPDPRLGEALHVLVVPKAGRVIDPAGLRVWAAGRIEKFKLPDAIHVCDALPLGPTGKSSRSAAIVLIQALLKTL